MGRPQIKEKYPSWVHNGIATGEERNSGMGSSDLDRKSKIGKLQAL